jgi:hypothetical protein
MPGPHLRSSLRLSIRATVAAAAALWVAALAPGVAAHVNRTIGPYTILVVLVEEPTFEDNHAGFQFWVRKNGVPITGLERTIEAVATGHGERVELVVSPLDEFGFYVLDHTTDGAAFDPSGGGAWTLFLTGSIEETRLDASFPVTFPSYPRVAVAGQPAGAAPGSGSLTPSTGPWRWMIPGVAATIVLGVLAALGIARRRRRRVSESS